MPVKRLDIPDIGTVNLYKRSGTRSIRLTIAAGGTVRVTLPTWVPYKIGIDFVQTKSDWIKTHQTTHTQVLLQTGDHIGKAHRLTFIASELTTRPSARITTNEIRITHPVDISLMNKGLQDIAHKACLRALRQQAEQLLPLRVRQLAAKYGFNYHSVQVKQLRSRWGSCNVQQELVFNLYLMQLPWTLIDYVILHELQHTVILRHGPAFWQAMRHYLPDVAELRKTIRSEQPVLKPYRP